MAFKLASCVVLVNCLMIAGAQKQIIAPNNTIELILTKEDIVSSKIMEEKIDRPLQWDFIGNMHAGIRTHELREKEVLFYRAFKLDNEHWITQEFVIYAKVPQNGAIHFLGVYNQPGSRAVAWYNPMKTAEFENIFHLRVYPRSTSHIHVVVGATFNTTAETPAERLTANLS